MSIESNIAELTAAVKELTAALKAGAPAAGYVPKTEELSKKTETKKVEEKKPAAAETASPPPGAEPPSTEATAAPAEGEEIPFKTLADAAIKLNTKAYDKLAAICKREKVAKISGLDKARYAAVLADINAELAALDEQG